MNIHVELSNGKHNYYELNITTSILKDIYQQQVGFGRRFFMPLFTHCHALTDKGTTVPSFPKLLMADKQNKQINYTLSNQTSVNLESVLSRYGGVTEALYFRHTATPAPHRLPTNSKPT